MQKYRLEKRPIPELVRALENSFNVFPVVPRDCVRALNTLVYNLQGGPVSPEAYKAIVFLVLRGFTSGDSYLQTYICTVLIELGRQTRDGILAINCLVKALDSSGPLLLRDAALRALFVNLPAAMFYDFEKYVRAGILSGTGSAVVVASEFFPATRVPVKITSTIRDHHQSFFNRLPMSRYTAMVEAARIAGEAPEQLSTFLFISADPVVFLEAAGALLTLRPERSAPFVEKAVHVLSALLKRPGAEPFASVKILGSLAASFPLKVAKANREIEDLVHAPCRCVSMIAVLTLLKTGTGETVTKLAAKLEPLLQTMSGSYKRMAIDTMETLATRPDGAPSDAYLGFLRRALTEKGPLPFKRYIVKKLDTLLSKGGDRSSVLHLLCGYLEDPEYYQVSMDVLGVLGRALEDSKDLVHVYNRLILDNGHVRRSAVQTLFDLKGSGDDGKSLQNDRAEGPDDHFFENTVSQFRDAETGRIIDLLTACEGLKRGPFVLSELGDLSAEVAKYIDAEAAAAEVEADAPVEPDLIKECRRVVVSPVDAEVSVSVVKKIFKESIILEFSVENCMERVRLGGGLLTVEIGAEKHRLELSEEDLATGKATREITAAAGEGDVVYGVFEYAVYAEGDPDDVDNDSISLEPFNFTVFDLVRPAPLSVFPSVKRSMEVVLDCAQADAAARIIDITNLFLVADKASFTLTGTHNGSPVAIEATMRYNRVTVVSMDVFAESHEMVDRLCAVFE